MARRWTRCALAFAAAVATLALASPASAVAPANDQVAGAFTIPDGPYQVLSTLVPDITDATTTGDPPLPSCQTSVSRSVWYKWTPGRTSSYRISTAQDRGTGSTLPDTVLAIYTSTGGNAGPFTQVPGANGCDDDSATTLALQSTLSGTFNAGTTYYLVVSKFGSTAPTAGAAAVQVSINDLTPPVAPANDQVAGAFTIPDGPYRVLSTLVPEITAATTTGDPPLPSCQTSVSRSVWYKWTPSRTSSYRISTAFDQGTGSTVDDTVLGIYTSTGGNAGPFTEVPTTATTDGCDDDSATTEANQSTLSGTFNAGKTYYVLVWKFGSTAPAAADAAVQVSINDLTFAGGGGGGGGAGTPTQTGAATDTVAPSVSGFSFGNTTLRAASKGGSIARKKPPVGTRVRYRVSEAGSARFTVERRARGRKKGKRCVAPTKKNRTAKRCTRYVKLKGSFSRVSKVGLNSFRFTGRLRGKKLRPGRYRLVMVATDIAKNKSKPKRAKFRVVRG